MSVRRSILYTVLALTALLGGCATSGSVDELNSRLDAIDGRLTTLQATAEKAEQQAAGAAEAADQSARQAAAAAQSAKDSARRSEAIFDKSVNK